MIGGRVLVDSRGELVAAADDLTHLRPAWLFAALVAEVSSYAAYGWAQRWLLRGGGGLEVPGPSMTAMAVTGQAAANCLPGGLAISAGVTFRLLSRRGVDTGVCAWMLTLTSVLYASALAVMALVGAQVAGSATDAVPDLRWTSAGLLVGTALVGAALYVFRHRRLAVRALARAARSWDTLRDRSRSPEDARGGGAARLVEHMASVRVHSRVLVAAAGLLLLCWVADGLCLALSFYTLGWSPPWTGLLLSYCAAQLAAMIPFTPGGLGVVEGSLTVALVAYGGQAQPALAAVLLYRLISFWGLIPAGAACYAALHVAESRRPARALPEPAAARA